MFDCEVCSQPVRLCSLLALFVWADEFFISSCCQCSPHQTICWKLRSCSLFWFRRILVTEQNVFAFLFYFLWEGAKLLKQWVAAPYHTSMFLNQHSDFKSHFLSIPYQCNCLSSFSFLEVFIFLHINCLFSLFLVMCPISKYFSAKFLLSVT